MIARMTTHSAGRHRSSRAQVLGFLFRATPWVALAAIAAVAVWYSIAFAHVAMAAPGGAVQQTAVPLNQPLTPEQTQALAREALDAQALKDKLKEETLDAQSADRLKDEVKGYLEWLIAIAGIFSIVGTIAAGFTAQAFTSQAEKSVTDAKENFNGVMETFNKELDRLKKGGDESETRFNTLLDSTRGDLDKFRAKYEGLAIAEDTRKEALETLKQQFGDKLDAGFDWRNGFYASMDPYDRQRLLSSERYLGYDLKLDINDRVNTRSSLRLLANFYVSKFEYENGITSGQISDLERAEYLLQLWTRSYPSQFEMRNDLGLVYLRFFAVFKALDDSATQDSVRQNAQAEKARYLELARTEFAQSRKTQPRQQRAQYNLAFISREEEDFAEAIKILEEARGNPNWEQQPNAENTGQLLYNLACYKALKIVQDKAVGDAGRVNELIDYMETLKGTAQTRKDQVDQDFDNDGRTKKPKGDLYDLIQELEGLGQTGQNALDRLRKLRPSLSPPPKP
jgi:hypothetical protein